MTRRGFWFLAVAVGALAVAVALPAQFSVALLGLSSLLWYGVLWTIFRLRVDHVARRLQIARAVEGVPLAGMTLWQNRPVKVVTTITSPSRFPLARVHLAERLPAGVKGRGRWETFARLDREHACAIEYEIIPERPGRLRFEGVLLELTDTSGFFAIRLFARVLDRPQVLPPLATEVKGHAKTKRVNLLPSHGAHRHPRAGSGSELFNLRDYVAGDPPKRIAWRVTARRGEWTTKEFESEVPVRTTIFLDHSDSVRVGWPGPTALSRSVEIAIALVRLLIEARDPVGLCLVDETSARMLPTGVGSRQQARLLGELCAVAAAPPKPSELPIETLIEPARKACAWLYPELLDGGINRRYFWQEWPAWMSGSIAWVALATLVPATYYFLGDWRVLVAGSVMGFFLAGKSLARLFARRRRPRGKMTRRLLRARKQVASVVAAVQKSGVTGLALAVDHDEEFSRRTQEFLIEHRVSYPRPLHGADGRYLFADPRKFSEAAKSLLRAVAHARDNEVFVLLIDLLEQEESWQLLLDACKVATSRHHEVLLIAPWPAELDLPSREPLFEGQAETSGLHGDLVRHYFEAYLRAKRELGRLGIVLVPAQLPETVDDVLRRMEVVRSARILLHP